jgi:hypothetical protein
MIDYLRRRRDPNNAALSMHPFLSNVDLEITKSDRMLRV